jgi:hypothetical protein
MVGATYIFIDARRAAVPLVHPSALCPVLSRFGALPQPARKTWTNTEGLNGT